MLGRFLLVFCLSAAVLAQTAGPSEDPKTANPAAASTTASDPLASANALLNSRNYADAAAAFKAVLAKDPASAGAHVGLVRSLLRSSQLNEALAAGKNAVQAAPSSALVHATLGDVNFRIGELSDAEAEYKAALKLDSNSARGLYGMGRLYKMLSMYKHAKDAFTKSHEADPSDQAITREWLETLPRTERFAAYEKTLGKHASTGSEAAATGQDDLSNTAKIFKAEAEKKPWVVVGGTRPVQLKIQPYGREWAAVDFKKSNEGGAMSRAKGYSLQAKFNDRAGATLLLDTGAFGILIGNKLAEKAGAVKIADSSFSGVGEGSTSSYLAWVDNIKIGDLEFKDCIVEVSSKSEILNERGIIGTNVFEDFLVTLDFRDQKVLLAPLPKNPASTGAEDEALDRYVAPEMQSFAKFYRFDHEILVPTVLGTAKKNATGLFMLDTGADSNSISVDLARKITGVSYEQGVVTGVSGKINELFSGDQVFLHFAGVHVQSNDITAFDYRSLSRGNGADIAGFIGITSLVQMKMTIDYRDGLLKLEPYQVHSLH
jgi:tetratricopeptide (TPR) repeat protein